MGAVPVRTGAQLYPAGPTPEFPEGEWRVPLEMVLALSNSLMAGIVRSRVTRQGNDWPKPSCRVFARGRRFFAEVAFHNESRNTLFLPLSVYVTENGLGEVKWDTPLGRAQPETDAGRPAP